jgi:hypothetical protein
MMQEDTHTMSSRFITIPVDGTKEAVLYELSGEGPEYKKVCRGERGKMRELTALLNRASEVEDNATEMKTEDVPEPPQPETGNQTYVDLMRRLRTAVQEWDLGWVPARRTLQIIDKIIAEAVDERRAEDVAKGGHQ